MLVYFWTSDRRDKHSDVGNLCLRQYTTEFDTEVTLVTESASTFLKITKHLVKAFCPVPKCFDQEFIRAIATIPRFT